MILFDKEGETPLDDISGLKIEGISTRSQLDEVEAVGVWVGGDVGSQI